MDPLFQDVDEPVFIVGGGASLADFNWHRLARRHVIALNLAFRTVPWASVLFFGDNAFWDRHKAGDGLHFWRVSGETRIFTTASHCGGMKGRVEYVPPAAIAVDGLDPASMNTGAQSILLAHVLGAKKIVLLGFDGRPGHWADEKPYAYGTAPSREAFATYAADFEKIAALGLDVVNAGPDSALTMFPTADLKDLL